jgi:hypothetical protein
VSADERGESVVVMPAGEPLQQVPVRIAGVGQATQAAKGAVQLTGGHDANTSGTVSALSCPEAAEVRQVFLTSGPPFDAGPVVPCPRFAPLPI